MNRLVLAIVVFSVFFGFVLGSGPPCKPPEPPAETRTNPQTETPIPQKPAIADLEREPTGSYCCVTVRGWRSCACAVYTAIGSCCTGRCCEDPYWRSR